MEGARGAPGRRRCERCGRDIKPGELAVRDLGQAGMGTYHQRCAPTLRAHVLARRDGSRRLRWRARLLAAAALVAGWAFHRRSR
jgi:hypothetical protein